MSSGSTTATINTTNAKSGYFNVIRKFGKVVSLFLAPKTNKQISAGDIIEIAELPAGYRPSHNVYFTVRTTTVSGIYGYITSDGKVSINNKSSSAIDVNVSLYLDTVTYVVD